MPSFCNYRMCHNLASSSYLGYCNQQHMERGLDLERKEAILAQKERKAVQPPPKEEQSSTPESKPPSKPQNS